MFGNLRHITKTIAKRTIAHKTRLAFLFFTPIVLVMAFFCLLPKYTNAQSLKCLHYTTADGLPHATVWRVAQDDKGYIWFGTGNGLVRFDGKNFEVFDTDDGLLGNSVTALHFDSETSKLWAGIYRNGLNVIDSMLRIESIVVPTRKVVTDFIVTQDSMVFWQANNYLNFCNKNNLDTTKIKFANIEKDKYLYQIFINSKSEVLITSGNGLYKLENDQLIPIHNNLFENRRVKFLYEDTSQCLWVGQKERLTKIKANGEVIHYTEGIAKDNDVHSILTDANGITWVSVVSDGLYQFQGDSLVFVGDRLGMGHTDVTSIFEDREKNVWFTTLGNGIFCVPQSSFSSYTESDGLVHNRIESLWIDTTDNALFIGTFNGLSFLQNEDIQEVPIKTATQIKEVRKIGSVDNKKIFLNIDHLKRKHVDGERKPIKKQEWNDYDLYIPDISFKNWGINYKKQIISYNFLDQYHVNFFRLNKNDDYESRKDKYIALPTYFPIEIIYADSKDTIWVGGRQGLSKVIGDSIVKVNENYPYCLRDGKINDFDEDNNQNLWIATNQGIAYFKNNKWQVLDKTSGLLDQNVTAILQDRNGIFWFGTAKGLNRFDNGKFDSFTIDDGLIANEISTLTYNSVTNELWVGTGNGLSKLNIDQLQVNKKRDLPVYITSVEIPDSSFLNPTNINVNHQQNEFLIQFTALNFSNPKSIQYQYRLNRLNRYNSKKEAIWRDNKDGRVEFLSLSDGNYTFEVRAKTGSTQWTVPKNVNISIKPPFWKTVWFFIFSLFTVALIVGIIAYNRLKKTRENSRQQLALNKKLHDLEQQALAGMMSPHFVFNALNSIQHYLNTHKPEEANLYLSQFAKLIRLNLNLASKAYIPLEDELDRLDLYLELEHLRFGDQLKWELTIDPDIDPEELSVPSMIIQPFVENAILHGLRPKQEMGKIWIKIQSISEEKFRIIVEDNGIGINYSQAQKKQPTIHKSKGIKISRERIENFAYPNKKQSMLSLNELKDDAGKIKGSQIIIQLPKVYLEDI